MYEKPQYITPGGFRRTVRNPSSSEERNAKLRREIASRLPKNPRGMSISPEAAQLIAMALRSMLRQK